MISSIRMKNNSINPNKRILFKIIKIMIDKMAKVIMKEKMVKVVTTNNNNKIKNSIKMKIKTKMKNGKLLLIKQKK